VALEPGEDLALRVLELAALERAERRGPAGGRGAAGRRGLGEGAEVRGDVDLLALAGERGRDGELADVAGPVVAREPLERGVRDALVGRLVAEVPEHALHEDGEIFEALAEGGELDPDLRDAEVEVAPEGAGVDGAHEIAPRRGDD